MQNAESKVNQNNIVVSELNYSNFKLNLMKCFPKNITTFILTLSVICFFLLSNVDAQSPNKSNIHYLTDTTLNFNALINIFQGKIIYVDIWATWCSPCRHELQVVKNVKDFENFAAKNNIIILYICCDKNGENWKPFISANKLFGYHILVNSNLNKDFHTTFSLVQKRQGKMKRSFYLPRHMIVDKNGVVVDSLTAHQGNASVYAQINKLLKQ